MPIHGVSAEHIAPQGGGFEPQRTANFKLLLVKKDFFGDNIVQLTIHQVPFPVPTTEVLKVPYGNEERKVPGRTTFADLDIVVTDYVDKDIVGEFERWRRDVYDPLSGKVGLAKDIKGVGYIKLLEPDGSTCRQWKLIGVWPSKFDPGQVSMERPDIHRCTLTLTVDRVVYNQK